MMRNMSPVHSLGTSALEQLNVLGLTMTLESAMMSNGLAITQLPSKFAPQ